MVIQQGQSSTYSDAVLVDEAAAVEEKDAVRQRRWMPAWFSILWENRKCRIGLVVFALFVAVAVFAPIVAPYDPRADAYPSNLDPSRDHLLGTTTKGEDIFSQLVYGARTSLIVGV